jgi:ribosome biogenesis GTPase
VLAANVDHVLIVSAIGRDTNILRLERFLAIVADGGATPAVVLTKADTVEQPGEWSAKVAAALPGVRIHTVSSYTGLGLDGLSDMLGPGCTVMLLGTSGAGKSTLVNALLGTEVQRTSELDADGKGRHTTTGRHLFALPQGGAIIDTPGVREVALAVDDDALDNAFDDIAELSLLCRFSDCRHLNEPGCAVREFVEAGDLSASRLDSWRRLSTEQAGNRAALAAALLADVLRRHRVAVAERSLEPRGDDGGGEPHRDRRQQQKHRQAVLATTATATSSTATTTTTRG